MEYHTDMEHHIRDGQRVISKQERDNISKGGEKVVLRRPDVMGSSPSNVAENVEIEKVDEGVQKIEIKEKKKKKQSTSSIVKFKTTLGSFRGGSGTARLLYEVGGGDQIRAMTTTFYSLVMKDQVLDKFIFLDDGPEAHGKRLGDWLVEKMGGEGTPWADSGRTGLRQESHFRAWHCKKREPEKKGRRFKLDDCRIWMRLMFWAGRINQLDEHGGFWRWYVDFISHFIGVYEGSAPPYGRESDQWSTKQENIDTYIKNGRRMDDVIGVGVGRLFGRY